MGLSGRKSKQRIPNDPRNLAWANDASKFGAAYLTKLGWDPSQGLGVSGEGRTKALSVHQKLDMLGIGADHKNSAEGLAWKQSKDFENLLRRLNAANGTDDGENAEEAMKVDGFVRAAPASTLETTADPSPANKEEADADAKGAEGKRSKKKRKKDAEDEDEGKKKRKKSKSSAEDYSDSQSTIKKKKTKDAEGVASLSLETATSVPSNTTVVLPAAPSRHPRAAFRARHMAAKNLASKSASAIAEILGLSPADSGAGTSSSSSGPTPYPLTPFELGPSTSSSSGPSGSATPADDLKLQELTVSSKSVMDYFKEKLAAKSRSSTTLPSTPVAADDMDDYEEPPRRGLGASRLRAEVTVEDAIEERRGLGGIGSGMRSQFATMFTSATSISAEGTGEPVVEDEHPPKKDSDVKDNEHKKKSKKKDKQRARDEEEVKDATVVADDGDNQKAERKQRREEKRRRKEAEAQVNPLAVAEGKDVGSDSEAKERKRKKDKKRKSKADS